MSESTESIESTVNMFNKNSEKLMAADTSDFRICFISLSCPQLDMFYLAHLANGQVRPSGWAATGRRWGVEPSWGNGWYRVPGVLAPQLDESTDRRQNQSRPKGSTCLKNPQRLWKCILTSLYQLFPGLSKIGPNPGFTVIARRFTITVSMMWPWPEKNNVAWQPAHHVMEVVNPPDVS